MIATSALSASLRCVVLAVALVVAGVASADDAGDSAPMPVPEAAPAADAPTAAAEVVHEKTLDDKVGDALSSTGRVLGNVGANTVDVLFLRTMGTAATCVGFGFFVVSSPLIQFNAPVRGWRESWDTFVGAPAEYTFERPLGQF